MSVRGWVNSRATVQLEQLGKLEKKFNDLNRNQAHDLSACSIAHQPTTLLWDGTEFAYKLIFKLFKKNIFCH
jgi:hypothetical protein